MSAFRLESSGTLSWAPICYLTACLFSDIVIFWELLCASSCDVEVVVSARRSCSALWARYPAVDEHDMSRKVSWTSRDDIMASSVARSKSGSYFVWGRSNEHVYVSHKTVENMVAIFQAAVTTVDANMVRCAGHCHLPWNGRGPLWTPTVTTRGPRFEMSRNDTMERMCSNFISFCIKHTLGPRSLQGLQILTKGIPSMGELMFSRPWHEDYCLLGYDAV
jgi:hypothetical protein